jgi:hypothetical protein
MKKILFITVLGLMFINCSAQGVDNKYLIGGSFSYSHDDAPNNSNIHNQLITASYFPYEKNYSNYFGLFGEFGFFLTQNNLLGIELGCTGNYSYQKRNSPDLTNPEIFDGKSTSIDLYPKYKFIKSFSDKIWFYTDFKIQLQYAIHKNIVSRMNGEADGFNYLNMNGNGLSYGLSITPGLIFKLDSKIGIKIDYSLINVVHTTIKKANNSDIDFKDINTWDYGLNMKLSELKIGIILII